MTAKRFATREDAQAFLDDAVLGHGFDLGSGAETVYMYTGCNVYPTTTGEYVVGRNGCYVQANGRFKRFSGLYPPVGEDLAEIIDPVLATAYEEEE